MEYLDEAGNDPTEETSDPSGQDQNKTFVASSFTTKNFYLEGVTFSTVEFPTMARTFSRSILVQSQSFQLQDKETEDSLVTMIAADEFLEERTPTNEDVEKTTSQSADGGVSRSMDDHRHVVQFGRLSGRQEVSFFFLYFFIICLAILILKTTNGQNNVKIFTFFYFV